MSNLANSPEFQRAMACAGVGSSSGEAQCIAQPVVIEAMDAYLEAAIDAVCNGDALECLVGDLASAPDSILVPPTATLVAAYLQGAAVLHAALIQGGKHADD